MILVNYGGLNSVEKNAGLCEYRFYTFWDKCPLNLSKLHIYTTPLAYIVNSPQLLLNACSLLFIQQVFFSLHGAQIMTALLLLLTKQGRGCHSNSEVRDGRAAPIDRSKIELSPK